MLSVVLPIFNEQESLPELHRRLMQALEKVGDDFEILFIDDGSTDASPELLHSFVQQDKRVKLIRLSRNFGHQPALTAGLQHASGDCVVLMDADLQDPPEIIPQLVEQWRAGYQVVLAERLSRSEGGLRGLGMRLFYPLLRFLSDIPQGPNAGIFGLLDRAVVHHLNQLPERSRFIPGLRQWLGFRQTTLSYDRQPRHAGKPKQSFFRLLHYAADAIFSFSYKPLRLATLAGLLVSAVAFLLALYYLITFFTYHKQAGSGFTTLILCTLFLGGIQLLSIGILGQYIARIYEEVKQRPLYVVEGTYGFGGTKRVGEGENGRGGEEDEIEREKIKRHDCDTADCQRSTASFPTTPIPPATPLPTAPPVRKASTP